MPEMKWKKAPESLVARFGEVVPSDPSVERRSMFGYPCAFLAGHMFCGLFQEHFIVRLPETARTKFLQQPGAAIFEPMPGRPMKEYVVVPPPVLASDEAIAPWLHAAREYVARLPPKAKKPTKAAKAKKAAAAPKPPKRSKRA